VDLTRCGWWSWGVWDLRFISARAWSSCPWQSGDYEPAREVDARPRSGRALLRRHEVPMPEFRAAAGGRCPIPEQERADAEYARRHAGAGEGAGESVGAGGDATPAAPIRSAHARSPLLLLRGHEQANWDWRIEDSKAAPLHIRPALEGSCGAAEAPDLLAVLIVVGDALAEGAGIIARRVEAIDTDELDVVDEP